MADDEDETETARRAGPRALWSGTITFGLVSIPIELYPAVRSTYGVRLKMVDEEGTPLRRRYVCPKHEALDDEEIVRGYELDDETYAVVSDAELEALAPDKSRRIELQQFVAHEEIDPRYVRSAYLVAPSGDVTQPYHLLARTMEQADKVGIATFVMRGHAYVIAIRAEDGLLRAETLRYPDEVRTPDAIGIPPAKDADRKLVAQMKKAIDALTEDELDVEALVDPSIDRLLALVEEKHEADEDVVMPADGAPQTAAAVVDLMQVLKERLAAAG